MVNPPLFSVRCGLDRDGNRQLRALRRKLLRSRANYFGGAQTTSEARGSGHLGRADGWRRVYTLRQTLSPRRAAMTRSNACACAASSFAGVNLAANTTICAAYPLGKYNEAPGHPVHPQVCE